MTPNPAPKGEWSIWGYGLSALVLLAVVGFAINALELDEQTIGFIVVGLIVAGLIYSWDRQKKKQPRGSSFLGPNYPDNWPEVSQRVRERDGYQCGNCGATTNLHVHHIVPLSKGGTNAVSNLRTLCGDCHSLIHPHMQNRSPTEDLPTQPQPSARLKSFKEIRDAKKK